MILVVGATGQLGGLITRDLLDSGRPVRALVRREVDGRRLAAAGGQPAFGDLKDAQSIRAACRDVDAVITTANAVGRTGEDTIESVDQLGTINLVQAAAAAGVRRFVYISALGADPDHPMPLLRAKGLVQQELTVSGMGWTVLQPNSYMDTWIPLIVGGPALRGDPITLVGDGRRRHSMVAIRDVAAYAAAALDHPRDARPDLYRRWAGAGDLARHRRRLRGRTPPDPADPHDRPRPGDPRGPPVRQRSCRRARRVRLTARHNGTEHNTGHRTHQPRRITYASSSPRTPEPSTDDRSGAQAVLSPTRARTQSSGRGPTTRRG